MLLSVSCVHAFDRLCADYLGLRGLTTFRAAALQCGSSSAALQQTECQIQTSSRPGLMPTGSLKADVSKQAVVTDAIPGHE